MAMTSANLGCVLMAGLTALLLSSCAEPKKSSEASRAPAPAAPTRAATSNAEPDSATGNVGMADAESPDDTACDGKPVTTLEEKHPDGSIRRRQEVVYGDEGQPIPHGLTTEWHENGQKKLEMGYHCGLKHGPRVTWYQSGQVWSEGEHIYVKDHGTWTVYLGDGTKAQEFHMVRGTWHGWRRTWHPNGVLKTEAEYVDGLLQGPFKTWNEEGELVRHVDYADGRQQPSPLDLH